MKFSGTTRSRQRGVVLVIALVLLVLLTLFAVTAIRSSTLELQIAGNEQFRKELLAAAQGEIERRMNTMKDINALMDGATVSATTSTSRGGTITASATAPVCIQVVPVEGQSVVLKSGALEKAQDAFWEVTATATDSVTGGSVTVTQGFRVRTAGDTACPAIIPSP